MRTVNTCKLKDLIRRQVSEERRGDELISMVAHAPKNLAQALRGLPRVQARFRQGLLRRESTGLHYALSQDAAQNGFAKQGLKDPWHAELVSIQRALGKKSQMVANLGKVPISKRSTAGLFQAIDFRKYLVN